MKVYIGKYPKDDAKRKIDIRIDKYDSWNADHTLALIIAPLLMQLKAKKHGVGNVDPKDCPEELRSTEEANEDNGYVDNTLFKRYDWMMDEVIWAMQEISNHNITEESFFDHSDVDEESDIMTQIKKIKVDNEGLKLYHARVKKGCELFGKYFQTFWD